MIHLYHGDGKGKTTAAMGLALRMAGRGKAVIIAQFLKSADSGERLALAALPGVSLLEVPSQLKFSFQLSQQECYEEQCRYLSMLDQILNLSQAQAPSLIVLDEVCDAVNAGLLPLPALLSCLDKLSAEVVLTGRNPDDALRQRADYVTRFVKERHPYDLGHPARPGVEY